MAELLPLLPSELPLQEADSLDISWWGDTSTSFGIGISVGPFWNVWAWASGFTVGPGHGYDIGWAEAVAVELGLLTALHHSLLAHRPRSRNAVLVRSDNLPVVHVLSGGRSQSQSTNCVLKRIYRLCACHGIHLHAVHVASRANVTDTLSRGDVNAFLAGFPTATTCSSMDLPVPFIGKLRLW